MSKSAPPVPTLGALELWQRELAAGVSGQNPSKSSSWRYDWLWRAAAWEAAAREFAYAGLHGAAIDCLRRAAGEANGPEAQSDRAA